MQHISGKNFDIELLNRSINVESANVKITDNRKAVYTNGVPNGYVDGDAAAEVELELDLLNFQVLEEEAKKAGSLKLPKTAAGG